MTSICVKCRSHRAVEGETSPRWGAWYNHICGAAPVPRQMNWVTGREEAPYGMEFSCCRDVNADGNCKLFVPLAEQLLRDQE